MRRTVSRGFGLLEAMIALALVSIGLLGAAALFGEALQQLRTNANHRAAVLLGAELADALTATSQRGAALRAGRCTIGVDRCFEEADLRSWLDNWRNRLSMRLPDASAELTTTASASSAAYDITIQWPQPRRRRQSQQLQIVLRR